MQTNLYFVLTKLKKLKFFEAQIFYNLFEFTLLVRLFFILLLYFFLFIGTIKNYDINENIYRIEILQNSES